MRTVTQLRMLAAAIGFGHSVNAPVQGSEITLRTDKVGSTLNEWAADNTAGGLSFLTYENRDGQHSPLNTALWPGLQVHSFSEKEKGAGQTTGPATQIRPSPTLGNCSMAAPADAGGSLPRFYFLDPGGNRFIAQQYLSNNLFIYPEHQDHDPGSWGVGGWGDLFPLNSPNLVISQGSSGSDQPFLQALLSAAAAFPPDTQSRLIEKRMLAPTLQMLLRQNLTSVEDSQDYFSGKAHPVVFDGSLIDEMAMVQAANRMTPAGIPPIALMEMIEETRMQPGVHFFEAEEPHPYKLADTPSSIGRIYRGNQAEMEFVISTKRSGDLMGRPLQNRLVILQGDSRRIHFEAIPNQSAFRLRVKWHPPIRVGPSRIRSHRVDIGFFTSNGVSHSPPAILSIYMLPNEMRFYDQQGRVSEIYYQAHNPDAGLPASHTDRRWVDVIKACILRGDGLPSTLMQRAFEEEERAWLNEAWIKLSSQRDRLLGLEADPERAEDAAVSRGNFESALQETLETVVPGSRNLACAELIETAVYAIARFTDLYPGFQTQIQELADRSPAANARAQLQQEVKRLTDLGVLVPQADGLVRALRDADERSPAENYYLQGLNLSVLSLALYPEALFRRSGPAWADPRLTTPKAWRDVYRYDEESGDLLGWVRHYGGRTTWFNEDGKWNETGPGQSDAVTEVTYQRDAGLGLRFDPAK